MNEAIFGLVVGGFIILLYIYYTRILGESQIFTPWEFFMVGFENFTP